MTGDGPFEPGRSIGPYEILRELGRGGMGRVYLARDSAVGGRLVAVKVILSAEYDDASEAYARFAREIGNLARLQHSHIVTIFTAGRHEGRPYFVMQYVPGRDLMRFVDECSFLGERERTEKIVKVIVEVAHAVQHAHSRQIIHRDLKPSNILVSHEGDQAMVLDFGIAKYLGDTSLTKGPESPGTPAFRAPEQIDVRLRVRDELVDVWALGVIVYRVLVGTYPFKGNDALSLGVQILQAAPEPPRTLNASVSPAIEKVILACLEKDPQRRPGSAQAVAELLGNAMASGVSGTSTVPTTARLDASEATRRRDDHAGTFSATLIAPDAAGRRSSRAWIWSVAGIGLLAGVVIAVWASLRTGSGTSETQSPASPAPFERTIARSETTGEGSAKRGSALVPPSPNVETDRAEHRAESRKAEASDMVRVPAGAFFMGCNPSVDTECEDDEKPGRTIELGEFWIDRTEVTVADYRRCVEAGSCNAEGLTVPFHPHDESKEQPIVAEYCNWEHAGRERHPINCVDWEQARTYCGWVGKRLPTEEEWEKAARGADARIFPWGNTGYVASGKVANVADESLKRVFPNLPIISGYDDGWVGTAPVGSFPRGASPYGAEDMIGNVAEWTESAFAQGTRVVRGGSWHVVPRSDRVSARGRRAPRARVPGIGFRCAR